MCLVFVIVISILIALSGVADDQLDDLRNQPELEMMEAIKAMAAAGQDLNALDAQGNAPVRDLDLAGMFNI